MTDPALWQDVDAEPFTWYVPERFNIAGACVVDQPPGDLALVVDDGDGPARHYSFGDLDDLSARLATALTGLGLERGDRLGVMVPQGLEVALAHLAGYRLGLVVLPLSVQFGPDALAYRLADAGARALVVFAAGLSRLAGTWDRLPELAHVVLVGDSDAGTGPARPHRFDDLVTGTDPTPGVVDTAADDPGLLIYTSGTTGAAKGALHRHQVVLAQMPGMRLSHDGFPQPGDVFWTPGDWAWAGGLFDALLPTWLCGRPIVASARRFSPEWAYELMARHGVTSTFLPPTALKQMRRAGPPPAGVALRSVASGGEALGGSILDWAREHLGVGIREFYGQTELNYTVGNRAGVPTRPGSMGRPYPGTTVAIVDSDDPEGREVPDGTPGEAAVALPHPGCFLGYWGRPEKTREKAHDGWLFTGDTVTRDAEGHLWFLGRADDVITSGGYRIGPAEIEECLLSHPAVEMAAVVGIPDEMRGQAVAAFVVTSGASGAADDRAAEELATELQEHVKHRLAFYEYPRTIRFVEELPMTATGKIRRTELRAMAAEEQA